MLHRKYLIFSPGYVRLRNGRWLEASHSHFIRLLLQCEWMCSLTDQSNTFEVQDDKHLVLAGIKNCLGKSKTLLYIPLKQTSPTLLLGILQPTNKIFLNSLTGCRLPVLSLRHSLLQGAFICLFLWSSPSAACSCLALLSLPDICEAWILSLTDTSCLPQSLKINQARQ